ncbi:MAG: hypothetical protein ACHREM_06065 [Polyangiales bacterium]
MAAPVRADEERVQVTLHPSAGLDGRDVLLERDHTIIETCTTTCVLYVPRGDYVVHELLDGKHTTQRLRIDRAVDVDVVEGESWRKTLGWPLAVGGTIASGLALMDWLESSVVAHNPHDWQWVIGGGAAAALGYWLNGSRVSSTHLDVTAAPTTSIALTPVAGGAALQVSGAF